MPRAHKTRRRQMVVVANDFQVPFHDEKALAVFRVFLRRERPDWLLLNGDFVDFWEISTFDLTPRTGKALIEEIAIGQKDSPILSTHPAKDTDHLDRREP